MKILISHDGASAHYFDRIGLARAFNYANHQVFLWDIRAKSAFDIFSEFEPDIFIGQAYNLDRAVIKNIESRPHMRVALRVGEWGVHTNNWTQEQKTKYPILLASNKEKDILLRLKNETNKPDFLYIHYHPDYLNYTHGDFARYDIPVVSLMNAADLFDYTNGVFKPEFQSDIVFIGGYWEYKAKTLDKYILPLCSPALGLKIRIFGNQGWSVPQFAGFAPDNEVKNIMKSAAICPNVSELHSQDFGYDVIERPFKLSSNKCFVVSDYVEGLEKIYGDSMEYGKTPNEFFEKIDFYLKNPEKKMAKINKSYQITLNNHTYFDRAETVFANLNMRTEVDAMRLGKIRFCKENQL
jgi:hypothetical protein